MLYPIMNHARTAISLDGVWRFRALRQLEVTEQDTLRWNGSYDTMAVPGSYNDQKEDEALRDHYGLVLYQRDVSIPKSLSRERVVLRFGSVTHHAAVYWNGKLIARHRGGFLPFEAEIDPQDMEKNNVLTVSVDNRIDLSTLPVGSDNPGGIFGSALPHIPGGQRKKQNYPNFDFFNYAGIARPVLLYSTPKDYIQDIRLRYTVEGGDAVVQYDIETSEESSACRVELLDEGGNRIAEAEGRQGALNVPGVRLWQPLDAYLYTLRVQYGDDEYEEPFGIRTVEVKGTQFLINGRPFYFKGYGKHEDSEFRGRGLDNVLNIKDIALMKWQGANSFRTSHYPYSEEMMRLCDREGIVVIDEVPAVGVNLNFGSAQGREPVDTFARIQTHEHHREVIRDLIQRDKNHACVVMWSIGNESDTATFPESAVSYYKPLYELAHEQDPQNRPVTLVGLQGRYGNEPALLMMDVICLNRYYGWYVYGGDLDAAKQALKVEMDYWATTGKPVMFTEYGADTVAGLRLATSVMFTEEYQVDYYKANHEVLDELPFFIGEQAWNFADFATSQGINRVEGNKKGLFTRDRRPKLAAHYFRQRWHTIPDFEYKN